MYRHSLRKIGLEINEEKSRVIMAGGKQRMEEEVDGIKVTSTLRYLGVEMDSSVGTCRRYVNGKVEQARRLVSWIR